MLNSNLVPTQSKFQYLSDSFGSTLSETGLCPQLSADQVQRHCSDDADNAQARQKSDALGNANIQEQWSSIQDTAASHRGSR
jgi:hypothetical protein